MKPEMDIFITRNFPETEQKALVEKSSGKKLDASTDNVGEYTSNNFKKIFLSRKRYTLNAPFLRQQNKIILLKD